MVVTSIGTSVPMEDANEAESDVDDAKKPLVSLKVGLHALHSICLLCHVLDKQVAMNNPPETSTSDDLANEKIGSAVSAWTEDNIESNREEVIGTEPSQYTQQRVHSFYCRSCDKVFNLFGEFHHHLLNHVQLPYIIVQRLNPSYVRRLISKKPVKSANRSRKRNFARKRIRSYIVPKVKNNTAVEPLKLTLKLATDASSENPSFKVVPQKFLVGPGDLYPANGGVLDEVKTEVVSQSEDVEWNSKSVEGEGDKSGEGTGRTSECTEEASEKNGGVNNVEALEKDESEEEFEEEFEEEEEKVIEDNIDREVQNEEETENTCLNTIPELNVEENRRQAVRSLCHSPTPSEQLRPDFLASEEDESCDSPPSPAMVEVSGTTLAEAASPAFPTTSPAPPSISGDSNSQHSEQEEQSSTLNNTEERPHSRSGSREGHRSDQGNGGIGNSMPSDTGNFNWNEVPTSNTDDTVSNAGHIEERDPLLIPDQTPAESEHENNSGNLSEGNSSDSLLRGFLCDASNGDKAVAVTTPASNVGNVIDGLGSEYISLERLGETGALACCDVCGEQTSNLEEHRVRAGHYKCNHPDCGNQVFPNLGELASHQHVTHGNSGQPPQQPPPPPPPPLPPVPPSAQQYPMPHHQPPPVQQLAQQVQRLPIPPPQQLSPHQMNHHPQQSMVQQMSPQLHQLMPPQQPYPQSPVRRPPPLYRVPGSGNVPGAPPGMQHQYPNHPQQQQQPHMMPPQMYNQQPYPPPQNNYPPPPGSLPPPRPYGNMVQQINRPRAPSQHNVQRPSVAQQQQPRMGLQQKRPAVTNSPGNSPNKQRRMDVLIPDRHDDADCHVIAMQKRTDSGPVIGSVQGAANNSARPESMIHLTDSITLSVRQPQGGSAPGQPVVGGGKNKSDAKAVANILATRGITVTPAGGTGGRSGTQQNAQQQQQQRQSRPPVSSQSAAPVPSQPVTTLNLNSAISIIAQPTASSSRQQQQQGNFAVPHGRGSVSRQQQQQLERPPRPPTVDLTGDGPPLPPLLHSVSRGRGRGRGIMGRHACQVCDKAFSTQESLNQHMALHRSPGKLPYRCSLCSAQYPTQQGLLQHRQTYHKEPSVQPGTELAVPVIDLKSPVALNRLAGLGVHHYIPLSQLGSQTGGFFGLPIVSVEGTRNPSVCNLGALGASSVLSLGPIKHLGR